MRDFRYDPLLYPSNYLAGMLRLERLDFMKKVTMVLAAHKLLNGHICIPDLLEHIAIYVPNNFIRAQAF